MDSKTYADLRGLDVSSYVEKKNGLSYLSWAWAVDQLLSHDAAATWDFEWFDTDEGKKPYLKVFDSYMVFCTVSAFGVQRKVQLPIIDYKNRPIPDPNAMDLNTAMMRCLAKAISLHGIGINIYAGEDLPLSVNDAAAGFESDMNEARNVSDLDSIASHVKDFVAQYPKFRDRLQGNYAKNKTRVTGHVKPVPSSTGVAALKETISKEK